MYFLYGLISLSCYLFSLAAPKFDFAFYAVRRQDSAHGQRNKYASVALMPTYMGSRVPFCYLSSVLICNIELSFPSCERKSTVAVVWLVERSTLFILASCLCGKTSEIEFVINHTSGKISENLEMALKYFWLLYHEQQL